MPEDPHDPTAGLPAAVLAAATEALAHTGSARGNACAALCAAHPGHAPQLQRLFAELSAVERLLDGGYGARDEPPARLGQYRVLRQLGGGAFGEVFLCEQSEPVRRNVAVKVLRAGVGDRTTLLRFEAERQLIASMQHPAIAQVFDAGVLADGRPFFVMDAIDGAPIDRWCDEHEACVEARIDLFCELCRGVQHAHDRGIVHRDLKPANVLVVTVDGQPRPKVIDFGIAKVLHGSDVARSFDTEAGRVIGTPGYMSPEQQKGASDDVDARADVFCLGVMLYEMLCGQMPWSVGAAATDSDPERPSTRVSTSADAAATIARARATQPRRLVSRLRGDLDWIVLKCLHREREQRYGSVQELIDDLQRHRRAEPVRAQPPSTAYRLRKLVRRHRTAVSVFASAAFVAICGVLFFVNQRLTTDAEIAAAHARGEASFATATEVVDRLFERANDPSVREAPEGDATRQAMLQDALGFYDRFLRERPTDPKLRAKRCAVLVRLVRVHLLLGDTQRGNELAPVAIEEADALWAAEPTNPELRGLLGEALFAKGALRGLLDDRDGAKESFAMAVDHLAAASAVLPARFGIWHSSALRGVAQVDPPHGKEWEPALRQGLRVLDDLQSKAPAAEVANEYVLSACELGESLALALRHSDCEAVLQEAAARLPLVGAERLHLTYRVSSLRGLAALQRGEPRGAIEHYQAALATVSSWAQEQQKRLLPRVLQARVLRSLGFAQNVVGDFGDSDASYRRAIAIGDDIEERFAAATTFLLEWACMREEFALNLLDRFDQRVLAEAAASVDLAVTLEQRSSGGNPSELRWRFLCLGATIADARIQGGGDGYWPDVESALASDPPCRGQAKDFLVGVHASLARWHLDHDRSEAATQWLARASALIATDPKEHAKRAVEVGWLTGRLAALRSDHAACAAAAEAVLAARSTWYGRRRAADCLHLAWRCAGKDPAATAAAIDYRDRALDWYGRVCRTLDQDVAKNPDDPWFVLPWGIASVRAAELSVAAGDTAAARSLLAAALPRLAAVRAQTHADQWDEGAFADGSALAERLATTGR